MFEHSDRESAQRLGELGHLASGVGHHVINAFAAIVSNAELLRLDQPLSGYSDPVLLADTIIKSALEASTVARRLIDFTRPVTAIEKPRDGDAANLVELHRLVGDLVEEERANAPGVIAWALELNMVPPLRGHEGQLRAMILHLLRNAKEALSPGGGQIRASTRLDERGWIVLELEDDGIGMDNATLQHAVEPFFSTKPGHLGVGLSIANGIWRRHRGTLSILSKPGGGTRARLCVEPFRLRTPEA